jgi:hypothetical protein
VSGKKRDMGSSWQTKKTIGLHAFVRDMKSRLQYSLLRYLSIDCRGILTTRKALIACATYRVSQWPLLLTSYRKTFVYHICLSRVGIQNYIYRHVQRSNDKSSVAQFDISDALECEEKQKEVWSSVMSECVRGSVPRRLMNRVCIMRSTDV